MARVIEGPLDYLELSHEEYDELMEKSITLSRITGPSAVDRSEFTRWVMEKFGLKMCREYHIIVI